MRFLGQATSLLLACAAALTLHAQTYSPKAIRIDAPPGTDTAEPLRIAALQPGPLSKEQIEAALQRIIDTGLFSDVSYTVSSAALVIKLTPAASSQALPVRYANFVWWQPDELEPLVEARLPIFHGSLPLAGTLTDQVEAVLVDLLKQKGVDAKVTATQSGGGPSQAATALTLSITSPEITIGDVTLVNSQPALKPQLDKLRARLHDDPFDSFETAMAVRESVGDIYQNAGYLDVATTKPSYGAPHKSLTGYAVDLTAAITSGEIYHVARFDLQPAAPLVAPELMKVAGIKVGDAASPLALRIAKGSTEQVYRQAGYLDAASHIDKSKDSSNHTVAYAVSFTPGGVYRFASLDTSALTPAQQAAFAQSFHVAPGAIANQEVGQAIAKILFDLHLLENVQIQPKPDAERHTVIYALRPTPAH